MAQISIEVLQANRLKAKRRIAAVLIQMMAETGISFDKMDAKLGRKFGYSKRYIHNLVEGKTSALDGLSDLATAMDCEFVFTATRLTEQPE